MADRTITADLIGRDRMSQAMQSAARATDKLRDKMSGLSGRMGVATRTLAKAGGMVAGLSSLMGPAALGTVKLVTATAHLATTMAPLAATLPAVAGGFALVKGTALLAGPAMLTAIKPITDVFGDDKNPGPLRKRIGELASQGLPKLAREFVRVNMPAIAASMERIATAGNKVVQRTGRWVNSAQGQHAIRTITEGTATAMERLQPHLDRVVLSFGNMVNRVGDPAIRGLGSVLERAADAAARLMDSVDRSDIDRGIRSARDAAGGFAEKLRMVRDVVQWLGDNQGKVKAFSDALAGIGIALGLAGGAWVAVVAGAVTLIANHWDSLRPKFEAAAGWVSRTYQAIANDPNVQRIVAALRTIGRAVGDDLRAAWAAAEPKLRAFGEAASRAWEKIGPLIAQFLENPDVRNGLRVIALGLATVAAALLVLAAVSASATAAATAAMAAFTAWMVGVFGRTILTVVAASLAAFGRFASGLGGIIKHIPGLGGVGRALEAAGRDAQGAANKVNQMREALDRVRSKTVTVTVRAVGNGVNLVSRSNSDTVVYVNPRGGNNKAKAAGGYVTAGWGYEVGDAGPERFVPNVAGRIVPNRELMRGEQGGGGGVVVNLNITGTVIGNPRELLAAVEDAVVRGRSAGRSMARIKEALA